VTTEAFGVRAGPIDGLVEVPGSKSVSNRALVCAALATGSSTLVGVAGGDDTRRMMDGLRQLGVSIDSGTRGSLEKVDVIGPIDRRRRNDIEIDAGLAGTTSRFLTAVAVLCPGRTTITGGAGLLARPMAELHRTLRNLGADLHSERDGFLPVTVRGFDPEDAPTSDGRILRRRHGELLVKGDVSSQFISAIMMIAPLLGGLRIRLDGPVVSHGYLDMTARVMREFGGVVDVGVGGVVVKGGSYAAAKFAVDADWSSASYPFAAAAIAGGTVTVPRLLRDGLQPEEDFLGVLQRMGCDVHSGPEGATVARDPRRPLVGVDVDMSAMSDLVPTLAAIAVCAAGTTRISGVGFIRGKESDRLGDLAREIAACGGRVEVLSDGLRIEPARLHPAVIDAHDDHRLAMALALLGLHCEGIRVAEPAVVAKSWPGYWSDMRSGLGLNEGSS
jgi:3-phosphoshikimate 1-carboxyvinyltransferase